MEKCKGHMSNAAPWGISIHEWCASIRMHRPANVQSKGLAKVSSSPIREGYINALDSFTGVHLSSPRAAQAPSFVHFPI